MRRGMAIIILFCNLHTRDLWAEPRCDDFLNSKPSRQQLQAKAMMQIEQHAAEIGQLIERYKLRLGFNVDPFSTIWNYERGVETAENLFAHFKEDGWAQSPLAIILQVLDRQKSRAGSYRARLVERLVREIQVGLQQNSTRDITLQSHFLALQYARQYVDRYRKNHRENEIDVFGPQSAQDENSELDKEDSPPEYPTLPNAYTPQTHDSQSRHTGGQVVYRLVEVDFKASFFVQRYFVNVKRGSAQPFRQARLAIPSARFERPQGVARNMIVRTLGQTRLDLFFPAGFKPVPPDDLTVRLTRRDEDGYHLEVSTGTDEIQLGLVEDHNILLTPNIRSLYTQPVGFKANEWPEAIQLHILKRYVKNQSGFHPLQVAQAIADHISGHYFYTFSARPETDPIDALRAGAFQCDMAAFAMIGLLRDVYGIPSRVVAGYRAKKYRDGGDGKSYLVIPDEPHAWVEVFYDRRWHTFDPTPVRTLEPASHNGMGVNPVGEYFDSVSHPPASTQGYEARHKLIPKSTESTLVDSTLPTPSPGEIHGPFEDGNNPGRDLLEDSTSESPHNKVEGKQNIGPIIKSLEFGSLDGETMPTHKALVERATRVLLRSLLDPGRPGSEIQNGLHQVSSLLNHVQSTSLDQIFQEATRAHQSNHPDLKGWFESVLSHLRRQDVSSTYRELQRIKIAIINYARLLDSGQTRELIFELVEILNRVQHEMDDLQQPESADVGMVDDLLAQLPSLAREVLVEDYGLNKIGANGPTQEIAKHLKTNRLKNLRLIASVSFLADFLLDPSPRRDGQKIKTWLRRQNQWMGQDLLPLERPSDMARAVLAQPHRSLEENIQDGTAFILGHRRRIKVPRGHRAEDHERVTVVLCDTSASMQGDLARFQSALIATIAGRALGDVSPSGRHRHRVILVPFDTETGEPIFVRDKTAAKELIRKPNAKLQNKGGGTDLQKALLKGMQLIARTSQMTHQGLASANMILLTDGKAAIDREQLAQARLQIPQQLPLQVMLVALGHTNHDLMRFAGESESRGIARGFYREFTLQQINDLLDEANYFRWEGRKDFHSEATPDRIPVEVERHLAKAIQLADDFLNQNIHQEASLRLFQQVRKLTRRHWSQQEKDVRPLQKWLEDLREFLLNPIFANKNLVKIVINDLVLNFEKITAVKIDELYDFEREHLRHLLKFAKYMEDKGP